MKIMNDIANISCLNSSEILAALTSASSGGQIKSPLASSNLREFINFVQGVDSEFVQISYPNDMQIVKTGKTCDPYLVGNPDYSYAEVPLGLIAEGDVIVMKGGKATKHLSGGDFIGLFETCDWMLTDKKREIGDWTLRCASDTKIIYFSRNVLGTIGESAASFRDYLIALAKSDQVPQPITDMPLLDWAASHVTESRIADHVVVIHTHLLPSTFPFFRHLSHLTNFGKIYILEKPYSTVRKTYDELIKSGCEIVQVQMEPGLPYEFSVRKSADILWAKIIEEQRNSGFKKVLIIDDGGDLWHSIPWNSLRGITIAGVEQTQRGITRIINSGIKIPPVISVASSGVKKVVESHFIGESIVSKLAELNLIKPSNKIGIIGMGSIGLAAAESITKLGQAVKYYDPESKHFSNELIEECPSLDNLLNNCELIIGTSGNDSLKGIALDRVSGQKIFTSASSADIEFSSLLKLALPASDSFSTRQINVHDKLQIDILNGGYPLNFDRVKNAVPEEDIALTWCLMYVGAMQAVKLIRDGKMKSEIYELDRTSQKKVLTKWLEVREDRDVYKDQTDKIVDATPKNSSMKSIWQDD